MRRIVVPLAALSAAIGLAACGSSTATGTAAPAAPGAGATGAGTTGAAAPTSAAAPKGGDPCALITTADAKQILSAKDVSPGKRYDTEHLASCLFKSVYVPGSLIKEITIGYYPNLQTADDLKTVVAQGVDQSDTKAPAKAVSGIGDAAYYVPGLGELLFLKGGRVYVALANIKGDPQPMETTAAKLIVSHL